MTKTHTYKQQIPFRREFYTDIDIKLFLKEFEKKTNSSSPFYYLTCIGSDVENELYTLRISTRKEEFVYYTCHSFKEGSLIQHEVENFIEMNSHLQLRLDKVDCVDDDIVMNRITMRFIVL